MRKTPFSYEQEKLNYIASLMGMNSTMSNFKNDGSSQYSKNAALKKHSKKSKTQ